MGIIISNDISGYSKKQDFTINKLSRYAYNQLCACGYLAQHQNELYLIDDDNYDVQNKRVINVSDPEGSSDAVNLQYAERTYIKDGQMKYKAGNYIVSYDMSSCISSDCGIYDRKFGNTDWTVIETSLPERYPLSSVYVDYDNTAATEAGKGLAFFIRNTTPQKIYRTSEKDLTKTELNYGEYDETLSAVVHFKAIRNTWIKKDRLVKVSELYSSISSINLTSSFETVRSCLVNLSDKFKNFSQDVTSDIEYSPIENLFD